MNCGNPHVFTRPLPGLGLAALALKGAEELHSSGFSDSVTQNISSVSLKHVMSMLENQYRHSSESGYTMPSGKKTECHKVIQLYKAFLDASGRDSELEALTKMPSTLKIGEATGAKVMFERILSRKESNKIKYTPSTGSLGEAYDNQHEATLSQS